jgi:hypothetical protein
MARIHISIIEDFIRINDIMDRGASFCQVDRINAGVHAIDVITDGYHRWHGAMPIFINRENSRRVLI